ncbi:MAG: geranylgeranyl pyrophosphate synthase [Hyphomicrobium sp.]|nr:geranylgeranyl pyrophosphate synthase [Hyphomicrobium sp.]
MDAARRIELSLSLQLQRCDAPTCPKGLREAMWHAVMPAGSRVRPKLSLAVALACGDPCPEAADAAAAAIELIHCASLVHDDLPCFDDAAVRRGRPSVHAAYGERLAVLAGDALIIMAFECVATGAAPAPDRMAALIQIIAAASGGARGITAGQAWECEPRVDVSAYHRLKTGELFAAATAAGAAAAGENPKVWRLLGDRLGEAYQIADDLRDVLGKESEMGKPAGRDADLGRPTAVCELGVDGAVARVRHLIDEAIQSIPPCAGAAELRALVLEQARRVVPRELTLVAA